MRSILTGMFDDTSWPKPEPPRRRAGYTIGALTTLVLAIFAARLPTPGTTIIASPSRLRQIEIFAPPFSGTLHIYLANAGFHDSHKHKLLATITGATTCNVTWQTNNAATINLQPATATIQQFNTPGIGIKFTS